AGCVVCADAAVDARSAMKSANRIDAIRFMMTPVITDSVLDRFRRVGAFLEGHFRLTSGLHSPGYLQCALVLQHPQQAEALGRAIADRARHLGATVVLSPAL